MSQGLILSIGPYSLSITRFGNYPGKYPRIAPNWVGISQSARGASLRSNTYFRPKHLWSFDCRLTIEQFATLQRMMAYYWANRGSWTIHDYTHPFEEVIPRTRALATGATESSDGTTTLYYAQFNAEPTQYINREEESLTESVVTLQFTETGATTA